MQDTVSACPHCGANLDGGLIWQVMLEETGCERKADEYAGRFGATRKAGRFSKAIIETGKLPNHENHLKCPECNGNIELSSIAHQVAKHDEN